jgi:hypothetical protein
MIRICPNCKSKNSLPTEGDASQYGRAVCRKCRADLFPLIDNSNGQTLFLVDRYHKFLKKFAKQIFYEAKWDDNKKVFGGFCVILILISVAVSSMNNTASNSQKPTVQTYQSLLEGVKPNDAKERTCRKLLQKYGHESYRINNNWYGKGVIKPHVSGWTLRINEPSWPFGRDLTYVFENETEDGFRHMAICQFHGGDYDYYEFKVEHFEWPATVMCSSDAAYEEYTC